MIGYVTLGSNDILRAAAFYDELLMLLGAGRFMESETMVAWAVSLDEPALGVIKPFDGKPASFGNGVMVA
ncbi:MAG: VOC family protein, partial [Reyranella sp.]|nr:VOC family protein [Reyranella sp.]